MRSEHVCPSEGLVMSIRYALCLMLCLAEAACSPQATRTYRSEAAKVELAIPASWTQEAGYMDRWANGGEFVQFEALGGLTDLRQVCANERDNTYRPLYGPSPVMTEMMLDGEAACRIAPSTATPDARTAFIATYPDPVMIRGRAYPLMLMWTDPANAEALAASFRFVR